MKRKKLCILLTALLSAALLAGCGSPDNAGTDSPGTEDSGAENSGQAQNTAGSTILKDMEVEQYVTLGEYKGLQVTVEPVSVKDEELNELMNNVYSGNITAENGGITDRAVEAGDTVNIDYEGKKDGVAFSGGTAQGASLTIGSGRFIEGFEDGLIGVMPGETVDLNLTFPEGYGNAELDGQAVVFTVTVNYILPSADQMEDEVIAGIGIEGVTNAAELEQYVYDYLYSNGQYTYDNNVRNAVLDALLEACTFTEELPKELLTKYEQDTRSSIETEAAGYGVDADTYTNYYFEMGFEDFLAVYCPESVKQMLALQAIADKENLNLSDEELEETLQGYATESGYETVDEFLGQTTREDYREYLMSNQVIEFLVENAVIANS